MKKIIALVLVCLLILQFAACGMGGTSASEESKNETPETAENESENPVEEGSGSAGEYDITIGDACKATDYDGNQAIVITYTWTNNSDETTSAMSSLMEQAFQDGVELESAIFADDSEIYDWESSSKDIRPGASIDVQCAYVLTSDSPVEFEVSEFLGSGDPIMKTFDLSKIESK